MLAESTFAGLTLLQFGLVSLALLIITMNVWSGWQNGIVRQILRIIGMIVGYLVGFYIGPAVAPLIPLSLAVPAKNILISVIIGLLTYWIIRVITNMLFRKTSEQESRVTRFIYGVGGGAVGLFFSVFFLIAFIMGIRLLGTVADAQLRVAQKSAQKTNDDPGSPTLEQFSKARQAIETGAIAPVVESIDPTPPDVYKTLDQIASVTSDSVAMGRFMNYPGTRELMQHPSLKKLAEDPKIQAKAEKKDFIGMMRDPKVIEMLKDDTLRAQLGKFELTKALAFSLKADTGEAPKEQDKPVRKAEPVLVY